MDIAIDLLFMALLLLFCVNGIWRGAYAELLGLVQLVLALLVATVVHVIVVPEVLYTLSQSYFNSNLVYGISLIVVFIVAWLLFKLLFSLLLLLTDASRKTTPVSLIAGGIIGTAKGFALIVLLVMAADYTSITEQDLWMKSHAVEWVTPFAYETRDGLVYMDAFARDNIEQLVRPYLPESSRLLNESGE